MCQHGWSTRTHPDSSWHLYNVALGALQCILSWVIFFYFFIVITTTLRCSHVKQMSAYTSAGRLNSHNPLRRICSLNSFNSLQNNCDHAVFCNAGDAAFVSLSSFFIPLHKANNSLVVIKLQRGCCLLWGFFYFFLFSFLFFFFLPVA